MTRDSSPPPPSDPPAGSGAVAHRLFPSGCASGVALVDRRAEYRRLRTDILEGRNAWFDCPRRYGVSSLIEKCRRDLKHYTGPRIAWAACRFLSVHDVQSFADDLLHCVGQLASQVIRRGNVTHDNTAGMFPGIARKLYLDERMLQTIRLRPGQRPLADLRAAVRELDDLAGAHECRAVFIVADLQQLRGLPEAAQMLDALRAAIAASGNGCWLVRSTNQHFIRAVHRDPDGPLHGSIRRFALRPINSSVYARYLAEAAQTRWSCYIGRKATAMILLLSDRHPLWLNELCRRLWAADLPPVIQDVVNEWQKMAVDHRHTCSRELERLTPNQRAVLTRLAVEPTDQPRAKRYVARTRVSSASVGQAIRILAEQDLIRGDSDGVWRIADPILQWNLHPRTDLVDQIFETKLNYEL